MSNTDGDQASSAANVGLYVSEYTGRSLPRELQRHLMNDSVIGPLGTLTGDVFKLLTEARGALDEQSEAILSYVHEAICRARHEISGDLPRDLPPRPVFVTGRTVSPKQSIEQVLQAAELPAAATALLLETLNRMTPPRRQQLAAAIAGMSP